MKGIKPIPSHGSCGSYSRLENTLDFDGVTGVIFSVKTLNGTAELEGSIPLHFIAPGNLGTMRWFLTHSDIRNIWPFHCVESSQEGK